MNVAYLSGGVRGVYKGEYEANKEGRFQLDATSSITLVNSGLRCWSAKKQDASLKCAEFYVAMATIL